MNSTFRVVEAESSHVVRKREPKAEELFKLGKSVYFDQRQFHEGEESFYFTSLRRSSARFRSRSRSRCY